MSVHGIPELVRDIFVAGRRSPVAGRRNDGAAPGSHRAMAQVSLAKLTTAAIVGMIANVIAELLHRERFDFDDGAILEMLIWRVPTPVPGSPHGYQYRLYYGRPGQRIVGYDNERPKGDYRHVEHREEHYRFTDVDTLVRDFLADVERWRSK